MPRILVDGLPVDLPAGALLTAALGQPPVAGCSLAGGPRGPLCGMGQCFECQLQVDGRQALACLTRAAAGMVVVRDGAAGPDLAQVSGPEAGKAVRRG
jgi:sarcosine oxidase subunit alpha